MRRPAGRTARVAFAVALVALVLAGGAAAFYYVGVSRSTPSATTSTTTTASPTTTTGSAASAPVYTYRVLNAYPHDGDDFTEGLVYYNGFLYESSGLYGNSSLRRVDIDTGQVLQIHNLSSEYFGEGITIVNSTIIQLTWQNDTGFVYDLDSFSLLHNFSYPTQGWGLTNNGSQLIMSDGTANLYFLNPQTFQRTGEITVHDGATPIVDLNSLDYINGSVFANVWLTNRIAVINPGTGQVTAWIDLTGIENMTGCHCDVGNDVLNGIAYDAQDNRLFVTGKEWPSVFQIEIVPPLFQLAPSHRLPGRQLDGAEAKPYGFTPIIFSTSASIIWNFLPSLASLRPTSSREVK
jgi:glutamine cyclotransferase